jgi:hypothetical protein
MKIIFPTEIPDPVPDRNQKKKKKRNIKYYERKMMRYCTLNDRSIRIRTGFKSPMAMFAFIVILNEGEKEKIEMTKTKLTWMQEWIIYFEVIWGRSLGRWVDFEESYGYSEKTV